MQIAAPNRQTTPARALFQSFQRAHCSKVSSTHQTWKLFIPVNSDGIMTGSFGNCPATRTVRHSLPPLPTAYASVLTISYYSNVYLYLTYSRITLEPCIEDRMFNNSSVVYFSFVPSHRVVSNRPSEGTTHPTPHAIRSQHKLIPPQNRKKRRRLMSVG